MTDIYGDDNPNTLHSTFAGDSLYGRGGDDRLSALGSFNKLYGEAGNDVLFSRDGFNELYGGDGNDTVDYSHAPIIEGGVRAAIGMHLSGGGPAYGDTIGADVENLTGTQFSDDLSGSDADNVLLGDPGFASSGSGDDLSGEGGNDVLYGFRGDDKLDGGAGADVVYAGAEDDRLYGSAGADILFGEEGEDVLRGDDGDDRLGGGDGADILLGGAGLDTASYLVSSAGVTVTIGDYGLGGEAEGDLVAPDVENIEGTYYADVLTGSAADNVLDGGGVGISPYTGGDDRLSGLGGNDTLRGNLGNDLLYGGAGADRLDGGRDTDTASYYTSSAGVTVNLVSGTGSGGEAQGDILAEIENLSGSQGNDSLVGNTGANVLQGWAGNDALVGAGGR
ncbi:calcium-binding protein, partial [Inquilinus sp. CA228]|uniref:calcium-binding protein n=1 Tax=Inquilinus sp. CA228 TaxID=3455609 RepID=UPI003F8D79FD